MVQPKSPAVVALELEQAGQRRGGDSAFQAGLEGTFPASDPVSATVTSVLPGSVAQEHFGSQNPAPAPLVDIALTSVRDYRKGAASVSPDEEMAALRAEVAGINESLGNIGSASTRVLRARGDDIVAQVKAEIRDRPLKSVAYAALAGFLFGVIR